MNWPSVSTALESFSGKIQSLDEFVQSMQVTQISQPIFGVQSALNPRLRTKVIHARPTFDTATEAVETVVQHLMALVPSVDLSGETIDSFMMRFYNDHYQFPEVILVGSHKFLLLNRNSIMLFQVNQLQHQSYYAIITDTSQVEVVTEQTCG